MVSVARQEYAVLATSNTEIRTDLLCSYRDLANDSTRLTNPVFPGLQNSMSSMALPDPPPPFFITTPYDQYVSNASAEERRGASARDYFFTPSDFCAIIAGLQGALSENGYARMLTLFACFCGASLSSFVQSNID